MRTERADGWGRALGVLWHQDLVLRELFDEIGRPRDGGVESRYDYGNQAKEVIRHVGNREAAVMDVAHGIEGLNELVPSAERMLAADRELRRLYREAGRMSRGIRGMDLNIGQNFDAVFQPLVEVVRREVDWELDGELLHISPVVGEDGVHDLFHSASWLEHHAPMTLDPRGERWFERFPVVSHALTLWDHMRDYPRAARGTRRP